MQPMVLRRPHELEAYKLERKPGYSNVIINVLCVTTGSSSLQLASRRTR